MSVTILICSSQQRETKDSETAFRAKPMIWDSWFCSSPYKIFFHETMHPQNSADWLTGIVQPGKSYRAVRTGGINWWTSENPYVIASIEAPLKSAGWPSKFVIFILAQHFF